MKKLMQRSAVTASQLVDLDDVDAPSELHVHLKRGLDGRWWLANEIHDLRGNICEFAPLAESVLDEKQQGDLKALVLAAVAGKFAADGFAEVALPEPVIGVTPIKDEGGLREEVVP